MEYLPSADERDWLTEALDELCERKGRRTFLTAPILEPIDRWFPDRWEASEGGVRALCRRLLAYAGLGVLRAAVTIYTNEEEVLELDGQGGAARASSSGHRGAAAWFAGIRDGVCYFGADARQLEQPEAIVGTMCHEIAHAWRHHHGLVQENRALEELLTDLTTIYLGFGILTVNNAYRYRASGDWGVTRWSHARTGYLSPQAMSYLLALQADARQLDKAARRRITRFLEPNQRTFFKAAVKAIADAPSPLREEALLWNAGKPVFKVSKTGALKYGAIGLAAGALLGAGAFFVHWGHLAWPAYGGAPLGGLIAGGALGRRRRRVVCSDPACATRLDGAGPLCPRCGGRVSARSLPANDLRPTEEARRDPAKAPVEPEE